MLRVGVSEFENARARLLRIVCDEDDQRVWFRSVKSFAQALSARNREFWRKAMERSSAADQ